MKISIITVCYNSELTIEDTLKSVRDQDYSNIELVVIDGGSTDKTLKIIESFSDTVNILVSESDKGIYDAMNKGFNISSGDIICFLNSDDYFFDNQVLSRIAAKFGENMSAKIIFSGIEYVLFDGKTNSGSYILENFRPWWIYLGIMPPHPGCFVRKEVFDIVGLFNISYKIAGDFDFFVRSILVSKIKFINIDLVVVKMRVGGVSTSGWRSVLISTMEMKRSLSSNRCFSSYIFILSRLGYKIFQRKLSKLFNFFKYYCFR